MNKNIVLSIICASNNPDILKKDLLSSLKKQSFKDYELIIIDAKKEGYLSASETLNYGASIAKGSILLFAHQDIAFLNDDALAQLVYYSSTLDFGVIGVAGAIDGKRFRVTSTVLMTEKRIQAGTINTMVSNAFAIDECLILCRKQSFKGFEYLGDTWHFYAVEYSAKCVSNGENVLVVPVWIIHDSYANSLDKSYFDTLLKYGRMHKDRKIIRTCCGYFKNNAFLPIYCFYRKLKISIKKLLKK